jgi:hypothetical protein
MLWEISPFARGLRAGAELRHEMLRGNGIALHSEPGALRAALNYYRANLPGRQLVQASRDPIKAETLVIWGGGKFAVNALV